MKTLIKYEFLKILRKKSTLIVMAVSLLLTAFLFGLPILQYQTYNQEGVIKGNEGIAYAKGQYSNLAVPLTEEYIAEMIREYQKLFENPDNVGNNVSAKYSYGFPDPQVSPIIVVDRYLDYFTTIMEDRLWQVLAKPVFRWWNRSGLSMNAARAA